MNMMMNCADEVSLNRWCSACQQSVLEDDWNSCGRGKRSLAGTISCQIQYTVHGCSPLQKVCMRSDWGDCRYGLGNPDNIPVRGTQGASRNAMRGNTVITDTLPVLYSACFRCTWSCNKRNWWGLLAMTLELLEVRVCDAFATFLMRWGHVQTAQCATD